MRIEDLQDKLHGDGTLAGGYAVVWNGTRVSASGTKYLDADDYTPRGAAGSLRIFVDTLHKSGGQA